MQIIFSHVFIHPPLDFVEDLRPGIAHVRETREYRLLTKWQAVDKMTERKWGLRSN